MNIVMLGHSGAGKTTYMSALYHIMTNGIYDFKMLYDNWTNYYYKHYTCGNYNYTLDEATKEGEELERVSQNVSNGIYPPATAIKQEYVFKMGYKGYNAIEFNWFDYRGGALMERENQSADTASLMAKIKSSDALIVFIDGTKLEDSQLQYEREFKRLIYLIKNAISKISVEGGTYYPISFVITKDDLCNNALDSVGFEYLWDNILKDIAHSKNIAGLITWVTINKDHIYNVHWPLFFSIYHCMHKYGEQVVRSYRYKEEKRGFWDNAKIWLTGEDKDAEDALRALNELEASRVFLEEILNQKDKNYFYKI